MKKQLAEALHEVCLMKSFFFLVCFHAVKLAPERDAEAPFLTLLIHFHLQCHAQQKVIGELSLSRQAYEEILSAKNKELEVTKVLHNSGPSRIDDISARKIYYLSVTGCFSCRKKKKRPELKKTKL